MSTLTPSSDGILSDQQRAVIRLRDFNILKGKEKSFNLIKQGIWAYFLLVIFEGALRKWILPGLATPLLIIRDPVAIWILFMANKNGVFPRNFYSNSIIAIGVMAMVTAIVFGHGSFPVAVFGARALLFHFPVAFVMGRIFTREDVVKMGKITLLISIPMTILIALQFYSPQTAYINRGIGGDEAGGGFSGSMDFFRPPGTFSFTNGTTSFYGFVACFVLYFWFEIKRLNFFILVAATLGLLSAIPLSISRGLFYQVALSCLFIVLAMVRRPKFLGPIIIVAFCAIGAIAFLNKLSYFQTATEVLTSRFETANDQGANFRSDITDRVLGGMVQALSGSTGVPFFGYGIGMGTNVGSMLLSGRRLFLISEEEWGRLIGEMGPIMGLFVIFVRIKLGVKIAFASYKRMLMEDLLPWILLSFGFLTVLQGGWSQPTSLGFFTIVTGLSISSLKQS